MLINTKSLRRALERSALAAEATGTLRLHGGNLTVQASSSRAQVVTIVANELDGEDWAGSLALAPLAAFVGRVRDEELDLDLGVDGVVVSSASAAIDLACNPSWPSLDLTRNERTGAVTWTSGMHEAFASATETADQAGAAKKPEYAGVFFIPAAGDMPAVVMATDSYGLVVAEVDEVPAMCVPSQVASMIGLFEAESTTVHLTKQGQMEVEDAYGWARSPLLASAAPTWQRLIETATQEAIVEVDADEFDAALSTASSIAEPKDNVRITVTADALTLSTSQQGVGEVTASVPATVTDADPENPQPLEGELFAIVRLDRLRRTLRFIPAGTLLFALTVKGASGICRGPMIFRMEGRTAAVMTVAKEQA